MGHLVRKALLVFIMVVQECLAMSSEKNSCDSPAPYRADLEGRLQSTAHFIVFSCQIPVVGVAILIFKVFREGKDKRASSS